MKKTPGRDGTTSFLDDIQTAAAKSGGKKSSGAKEMQYTVVKRNGTLVPFRRDRILHAIEAAFRDTKKVEAPAALEKDLSETINQITDAVSKQVLLLATKGACLTVEGIQDVVEVTLMKNGHHDVARAGCIQSGLDGGCGGRPVSVGHSRV